MAIVGITNMNNNQTNINNNTSSSTNKTIIDHHLINNIHPHHHHHHDVKDTHRNNNDDNDNDDDDDHHEHDMVMPGFRFHPTEEELVEFYLRRKVEGKRFNVELITFLDLYRYDPWELPALAAIGEKEWFFYVPRDRKYRNGDRPNRVTTSGYWKATGADRMIRTDNSRSIGLKKTLVFYSGKAPKGIRTSWIMNEYRLPHHETEKYQKAEISLCRVYKRPGVEDHPSLPRCLTTRPSSSRGPSTSSHQNNNNKNNAKSKSVAHHTIERFQSQQIFDMEKLSSNDILASCTTMNIPSTTTPTPTPVVAMNSEVTTGFGVSKQNVYRPVAIGLPAPSSTEREEREEDGVVNLVNPTNNNVVVVDDDLHRLVTYQQVVASNLNMNHLQQNYYNPLTMSSSSLGGSVLPLNVIPTSLNMPPTTFSDGIWDWNPVLEPTGRDNHQQFNNLFK